MKIKLIASAMARPSHQFNYMLIFNLAKETDVGPANSEGSSDQNQEICRSGILIALHKEKSKLCQCSFRFL